MNTILQNRINEAAKTSITETLMSTPNYEFSPKATDMLECAYIKGAEDILKNQWISVEEALPDGTDDFHPSYEYYVLARLQSGHVEECVFRKKEQRFFGTQGLIQHVTHWMPTPTLEGCEK